MIMKTHILNRLLPSSVRTFLRQCAVAAIPSMRHLDMPKRLRQLKRLGINPKVIYDVGAAQGEWTRLAASIWPEARIIGFEPNRANVSHLDQTRRDVPQFEYLQCFLGTKQQVVQYDYQGNQTSLYDSRAHQEPKETAEMFVLDDLIAQKRVPLPNFIKMDVQGYELEVLRGGLNALETSEAVLLEVNFYRVHPEMPTVDEVIEFMKAHRFSWFDVMGILRRPGDDLLGYMDLLFVATAHRLRQIDTPDWWTDRLPIYKL